MSLTTSAEEGALANDRLSTLSTVGTGYRSLIYDLKPDAGFATLSKACNTIWEALKLNANLPKLLVNICSFFLFRNCPALFSLHIKTCCFLPNLVDVVIHVNIRF